MTDKTKWDYVNNKVWADNVEWVEVKSRPLQHGSTGNANASKEVEVIHEIQKTNK